NSAVSVYGAYPVFFLGFVFFAMNGVGLTIPRLIRNYKKNRLAAKEQKASAARLAPAAAGKTAPVAVAETPGKPLRRGRKAIDIPVDEPTEPVTEYVEEKVGFFNIRPRVKTPDQVLAGAEDSAPQPAVKDSPPTDKVTPMSVEEAAAVAGVAESVSQVSSNTVKQSAASKKISHEEVDAQTEEIAKSIVEKDKELDGDQYRFPPLSLLKTDAAGKTNIDGREEIALNRERLESTIRSFGVSASITGVTRGPTVTRYDLELEQGVKLAKLTNLAGDLALSLGVTSVRIAPIPDKISTVGVEVPNKLVSTVYLHDIIDSPAFKTAKSKLTFAIGEDIGGNAVVGNIAKLPHMLIAGTTGSGKSVCMNSLILSILYKATPEEVRLIMIDPKMVELGIYNGVPHLYVPVVTDPKKAAGALQWAVVEMLKRYRLFSEVGVRDLASYNAHQKSVGEQTLPRVVIVIDELADLMLVASKEVEESVCRVAQMGRASGMHLIIATQRPSADVITGLMKANIPSRIAFAVSSAMESRIILDNAGAEKLIGAGDMLYFPLGSGKPMRIQGSFVSDEERENVINFVKESAEVNYSDDILAQIEKAAEDGTPAGGDDKKQENPSGLGPDYDELLPQAVDVIFETKQASVSMLQRRLKLGYARAARIVDQMEELGIVGPFEGSKPRQLLINKQQWQEMQNLGTAPNEQINEQVSFSDYEDEPASDWKD
ncbi:MAG: DNA translocase FtsK, partial [Clostridiales bacterium]|nr:DNA translocase FtsK [Clostridiales bacterium]